jgi:hypothetical protein
MAEHRVIVEGTYNPTTGATVPVTGGTSSTPSYVTITDGTNNVTVSASASVGNALAVSSGSVFSGTTLNAVTGNATGTAVDSGSARSNWSFVAVGTSTLTGTLTLELSVDNVAWVSSTVTASLTAAGTVGGFSTGRAARYARVSLTAAAGSGSVTVKMMAAG